MCCCNHRNGWEEVHEELFLERIAHCPNNQTDGQFLRLLDKAGEHTLTTLKQHFPASRMEKTLLQRHTVLSFHPFLCPCSGHTSTTCPSMSSTTDAKSGQSFLNGASRPRHRAPKCPRPPRHDHLHGGVKPQTTAPTRLPKTTRQTTSPRAERATHASKNAPPNDRPESHSALVCQIKFLHGWPRQIVLGSHAAA